MVHTSEFIQDILRKCEKVGDCLVWKGSTTGFRPMNQYGIKSFKGKVWYVHRLMYEFHHKEEIQKGHFLCRTCETPLCVNPEHYECRDRKEFYSKLQEPVKGVCKKGHPIRETKSGSRYCPACAKEYAKDRMQNKKAKIRKDNRITFYLTLSGKFQEEGYLTQASCKFGNLFEACSRMSVGDVLFCASKNREEAKHVVSRFLQISTKAKIFSGRIFTTKTDDKGFYVYRAADEKDAEKQRERWGQEPHTFEVKSAESARSAKIEDTYSKHDGLKSVAVRKKGK